MGWFSRGVVVLVLIACRSKQEAEQHASAPTVTEPSRPSPPVRSESLLAARSLFKTTIVDRPEPRVAPEPPPAGVFRLIEYPAKPGKLAAYLTPDPGDRTKRPAIVWITGGDVASIGDVWSSQPVANDQSAGQYRAAGIVMMYPSLRGGNANPGRHEGFYGEVDDVLAAAEFLAQQPYVDATQIYLGGHSTGGTLALLVAAAAPRDRFRAVISFGAVHSPAAYGIPNEYTPVDLKNAEEERLRAPIEWINTVTTPTFIVEGETGNLDSIDLIRQVNKKPNVQFFAIAGRDHFSVLAPINRYFASQIAGPWKTGPLVVDDEGLRQALGSPR